MVQEAPETQDLQRAEIIVPVMLSPTPEPAPETPWNNSTPDVCIVGAGIAGLRCAAVLLEKGARVTIFEARDRVGGRIWQSNALGKPVDLGAQWIHMIENNPLLEIAIDQDIPLHTWGRSVKACDSARKPIRRARAAQISERRWKIIREAIVYSKKHRDSIPASESLYDFFVRRAKQEEEFPDNEEDRKLLLEMVELWGGFTGDDVRRQSLRFMWMEECAGGDDQFVSTTYRDIIDHIARPARRQHVIRLGMKVTGIQTKASGSSGGDNVVVTVEGGQSFTFDEVVVTAPLGWLKRNQEELFTPPLEERLVKAIQEIGYGHLEKIYIKFPRAFWKECPPHRKEKEDSTNHERTTPSSPSPIGYLNFLSPSYAPITNPSHQPLEAYDLSCLPTQHSSPTLLFFTWGASALRLTTSIRTLLPQKRYEYLKTYFTPYYSLLPGYASSDPACVPDVILSTDWAGDELAGNGSYTNFPVGMEDADGDVEVLRRGLPERGVWFAGEHTAPFRHMGTATGAYCAGEEVAGRIGRMYGIEGDGT